ncbi:hypothetical protein A6R68_11257 [Neotoma lepida]|uniref:Transmembrane protein 154 n=1 Tax=Neotoma lepida TaxID=56216 RepID=A0A1A6FVK1_NEOLE|nr:hypothetical protein A6R68_11257 [Neotoma lepida]
MAHDVTEPLMLSLSPWQSRFCSCSGNDDEFGNYSGDEETTASASAVVTTEALATDTNSTYTGEIDESSNQMTFVMVVVPLAVVVILLSVVLIAIYLIRKKPKKEPSSQGSQSVLQTCEYLLGVGG